jgi:hypothetical protein
MRRVVTFRTPLVFAGFADVSMHPRLRMSLIFDQNSRRREQDRIKRTDRYASPGSLYIPTAPHSTPLHSNISNHAQMLHHLKRRRNAVLRCMPVRSSLYCSRAGACQRIYDCWKTQHKRAHLQASSQRGVRRRTGSCVLTSIPAFLLFHRNVSKQTSAIFTRTISDSSNSSMNRRSKEVGPWRER